MSGIKKRISCFCLVLLLLLSCCCGQEEKKAEEGDFSFGFSVYDNSANYFKRMSDAISLRCAELDIALQIRDSAGDGKTMVNDCNEMIDQGVDALLISPCHPDALVDIVERAHQKDIPVIIIDIGDGGSDKDAMIISDCFGGGEAAARYAAQILAESGNLSKRTVIIKCEESAVFANQRGEGYKRGMEEQGFTVVEERRADSSEELAYEEMKDVLAKNADISNVFAENDAMALGAFRAIKESGKDGVVVIGFNGDVEAISSIKAGEMKGTVVQEPFQMGYKAVETAVDMIEGTPVEFQEEDNRLIYADVYMVGADGMKVEE